MTQSPPSPTPTAGERIARLKANFVAQLPLRLNEAWQLLAQASAHPEERSRLEAMHLFWHSLKGTARSFGFRDVGHAAIAGEQAAMHLLDDPHAVHVPGWQAGIFAAITALTATAPAVDPASDPKINAADTRLPTPATPGADNLVYICDSDAELCQQLATQLECFSYRTQCFADPESLSLAVRRQRPGALIIDTAFPAGPLAGTQALAALHQEISPPLPTIFLSGRNDFDARLGAVKAGGGAYFLKPASPMALISALDDLTLQRPRDPYRVLIVDDQSETADYHAILLQEAGIQTRHISDPTLLLDTLAEFQPDLLLTDMYQPDCSGRDLAQLIRQLPNYVGLPIIYLSSETDKRKQFSAMRVGAEGFLVKPVAAEELIAAVVIRAERMRTLRSLMARDSLSGLFNHSTTTQLLEQSLALANRRNAELCFVMIDIDHFKSVNDTHGHPVGDQVIVALARILQQRVRHSDVVGRYGGEEFAVILQDASPERAFVLLEDLRLAFSRVVFTSLQGNFSCTFSAGIASSQHHHDLTGLREAADQALYSAKRQGRNRVMIDQDPR